MESIGHRGGLIARSAAILRIICILIVIIIDKDKNVLADGGTVTKPTVGAVWPKPFSQNSHPTYLALQPHVFKFKVSTNLVTLFIMMIDFVILAERKTRILIECIYKIHI